tara:strand:+ start:895 stop:1287 length:393 start_codon:yes stop_codon:yes gene_type:complete
MLFSLINNLIIKKGKKSVAKNILRSIKFIFTKKHKNESFESFFLFFLHSAQLHAASLKSFKRKSFTIYALSRFQKIPRILSSFLSLRQKKIAFYLFLFSEIDKTNVKESTIYSNKIFLYKSLEKNRLWRL